MSEPEPLISIGIPCHDAAQWIGRCVDSALALDWPNTEVIVVDDGSTDGSLEILTRYGASITLVTQDRGGANRARNAILARASGRWIQWLDADDELLPGKLRTQLNEAGQGEGADVLYGPVLVETWHDGAVRNREATRIDTTSDPFVQWFAWQLPQTGAALWRRDALVSLGGWNEQMPCCQEHELYLRALTHGLRFAYTPTPGAVYRIWSESTLCRRDPTLTIRIKTALIDELSGWLKAHDRWTTDYQATAGQACFEMARTFAKYDLPAAAQYAKDRQAAGLWSLSGPAAPTRYRLAYHLLGFEKTERLAHHNRTPEGQDLPDSR